MTTPATVAIEHVSARSILDSRGFPTIEVSLLVGGQRFVAFAPAGTSTGEHEAIELRDQGRTFSGRGVQRAVIAVNGEIEADDPELRFGLE